mgnify:CR=1 FL=1
MEPLTVAFLKRGTIDLDDLDKMWCVFDRDDNNPENIEKALIRAEKNGFKIAFSNPCFEICMGGISTSINCLKILNLFNDLINIG